MFLVKGGLPLASPGACQAGAFLLPSLIALVAPIPAGALSSSPLASWPPSSKPGLPPSQALPDGSSRQLCALTSCANQLHPSSVGASVSSDKKKELSSPSFQPWRAVIPAPSGKPHILALSYLYTVRSSFTRFLCCRFGYITSPGIQQQWRVTS